MTATPEAPAPSRARRVLAIAQRVFLIVALIAIAAYLARHAGELSSLLTAQVLYRCLLCALLLAALHPMIGCAFFLLQRHLGIRITLAASLSAYMRRIPARYIPGGIWHSAARYADLKFDGGVGSATLRQLFVMEMLLVASTGLIASGAGIFALPAASRAYWVSAVQASAGLLALLTLLIWRMRRSPLPRLAAAAGMFVLIWTGSAAGFVLIASAVTTTGSACAPDTLGASYLVAAVQGYIAIFAPQGWGITEASFTVLNPCDAPLHATLGAFLLFRVSGMLGDIVSFGAWAAFFRKHSMAAQAAPQDS